ncbi:hypothetical protein ACRCUN_06190 [Mycobacterium sp. LTG2003]
MSALPSLRIPDGDRDALVGLLKLGTADGKELSTAIDASDGSFNSVADLLGKHDVDGRTAFTSLMSLMAAGRRFRISSDALVEVLTNSFGVEDAGMGITALLNNATIQRYAKALTLRNEYERIVTDTRILSDIRPVFDDDEENPGIRAAIVNHTLRFTYTAGDGERHESHFALDVHDLEKLKAQIERALKKDKASQSLVETASVVVLQPLEDDE